MHFWDLVNVGSQFLRDKSIYFYGTSETTKKYVENF